MSTEILKQLAAPFDPHVVSWRVTNMTQDKKKGQAACYIDARDVQRRLDYVMGTNWSSELGTQGGLVTCKIGLYIDGQWVYRQDGTAAVRETDQHSERDEAKREMNLKGAASDALKRTAVQWGIGRYLYSLDNPWVALDQRKRIEKSEQEKLFRIVEQHYDRWHRSSGGNVHAMPQSNPGTQKSAPGADAGKTYIEGDEALPILAEARKNTDFHRIEILLSTNVKTDGDITRIIGAENNKAAIEGWPDAWKGVMRGLVKAAKAKASANRPPPENRDAA